MDNRGDDMPRARSPKRDEAYKMWLDSNGKTKLKDIASALGVSESQVRKWKNLDKWNSNVTNQPNGNVTKRKRGGRQRNDDKVDPAVEQVVENTELTDKQKLFCLYYIRCFNATKAYKKAYECSYETAMVNGYGLLRNTKVKEEILRLKQNRLNREMLDESDIFQWYLDIARADIKDYVEFGNEEISVTDKQGNEHTIKVSNVNIKNDREVDGILISEISKGKDGVKVKLPDKLKAMDWIADHMNLATEKQRAEIEQMRANTERLRRDFFDEEEDGVEIVNDAEQEETAGKDIGDHHLEVSGDI
ncbi:phage portal protein [Lachnospiraceae bacterium WCA-9-b2]|uniref:Phage portal protein n=2 Tax=Sporofaciens musculi TaxID=2681861 RepID=A0A7X3SKC5_9FIRM|nr:terminase small subunit [Sporofaciens musculi]MXP77245.1 phage portal protein [Sporofaciens musculi]